MLCILFINSIIDNEFETPQLLRACLRLYYLTNICGYKRWQGGFSKLNVSTVGEKKKFLDSNWFLEVGHGFVVMWWGVESIWPMLLALKYAQILVCDFGKILGSGTTRFQTRTKWGDCSISILVSNLMEEEGTKCNEYLIRDVFTTEEANAILSMGFPISSGQDDLIWYPYKSKKFTIWSAYNWNQTQIRGTSPDETRKIWKALWSYIIGTNFFSKK